MASPSNPPASDRRRGNRLEIRWGADGGPRGAARLRFGGRAGDPARQRERVRGHLRTAAVEVELLVASAPEGEPPRTLEVWEVRSGDFVRRTGERSGPPDEVAANRRPVTM